MYKIAVIEDHQSTNDLFKSFIKDTLPDSEVSQFLDLESAITALNEVEFDLVVSDVDLGPGTDEFGGVKIARALNTGLTGDTTLSADAVRVRPATSGPRSQIGRSAPRL